MRVFKLMRHIRSVRMLLGAVRSAIGAMKWMVLLMFFFVFMAALLGLEAPLGSAALDHVAEQAAAHAARQDGERQHMAGRTAGRVRASVQAE